MKITSVVVTAVAAGILAIGATPSNSSTGPDGLFPADIVTEWGTHLDYAPTGFVRTNVGHYEVREVSERPYAIASRDWITYDLVGNPISREAFDLKDATFTRVSDGATMVRRMWMQAGNARFSDGVVEDPDWNGACYPASVGEDFHLAWDLTQNADMAPDPNPANRFRISVQGYGIPFALDAQYNQRYMINTWYTQGSIRGFIALHHELPRDVPQPWWSGPGGNTRFCLHRKQAFWNQLEGWVFGGGGISAAGWPTPWNGAMTYWVGAYEQMARATTPMWWSHVYSGRGVPPDRDYYALWPE